MLKSILLLITVILLVVLSINIHLLMLMVIMRFRKKAPRLTAGHIVGDVSIAILAHSLEIILFAMGMYALARSGYYGHIVTSGEGSLGDFVYFSAITYTSLGFGDITPVGPLRVLAGVEVLIGLVLSAWTASVIFSGVLRYSTQNE
jgi:hypothetical protein